MKYIERKEFLFDPEVFSRADVKTALRIQAEYVSRHSPRKFPKFMEVDRANIQVDTLWHVSKASRLQFSREIDIPAINYFEKPRWTNTPVGLVPRRNDKFWLANLHLQCADYFPERGDVVFWDGYRYVAINIDIPPEAYWQQTGVWLGLSVECSIVPEGDAKPIPDLSHVHPVEMSAGGVLSKVEAAVTHDPHV